MTADFLDEIPLHDEDAWMSWFEGLSANEKEEVAAAVQHLPRVAPVDGPQRQAFNSKAHILGYGGAAGGGKASGINDLVVTPHKMVEFGDLGPGDKICDPFGGVQRVNGVRDWRDWPVWRVSFSDGTSIDTTPEHEWTGWWSRKGRQVWHEGKRIRLNGIDGALKLETQQILREMEKNATNRFRIPLCEPAVGNYNKYETDPYVLGALLGDGSLASGQVIISVHAGDEQILREMQAGAQEGEIVIKPVPGQDNMVQARLPKASPTHTRLRDLGMLGKRAWEKELPSSASFAPVEWRWSLLQGLMDTDGTVEKKRCAYFTTTSPHLRDGVADLARSLGCFVTITDKSPTFTYKGERRDGRPAYTLRIKSATPEKLFRLKRKRDMAADLSHQSLAKEITDITDLGERRTMRCINVSHPSGLYLTNNYTVTHNSALIALLVLLGHQRSVIFRYDSKQLRALVDDIVEFVGTSEGLNRQSGVFYFADRPGHMCEFGGIGKPGEEMSWRGRPHDFMAADEVTELSKKKLMFLSTWLRTTDKKQRTRVVFTFNPPGSAGDLELKVPPGRWVVPFFGPWLDERHPNPAHPGELRYFVTGENGEEQEVDSPHPIELNIKGEIFEAVPRSRTFIPARVTDNPYLSGTNYEQQLLSLEEPFRSQMLLGDFRSGIVDRPNQVIPTAWVDEAMDRWTPDGRKQPMSALGCDVAIGGAAFTVIARRHGWWWDEPVRRPGREMKSGGEVAGLCVSLVKDAAPICIDAIGIGQTPYEKLQDAGVHVHGVIASQQRDLPRISKMMKFYNRRAWLYWMMRRVLDPENGLNPALPPDNRLRADLLAMTWRFAGAGKILMQSKEELRNDPSIGHSTDDSDAVVLSLFNALDEPESDRLVEGRQKVDLSTLYGDSSAADSSKHGWMSL